MHDVQRVFDDDFDDDDGGTVSHTVHFISIWVMHRYVHRHIKPLFDEVSDHPFAYS